MIDQKKVDEWIQEVEKRPTSASLIIQYISNRLNDLSVRNEELAAQNIELLSGRKVEEYQNRITSLEYQLELLKRQLGGEVNLPSEAPGIRQTPETVELFLYNLLGQVLHTQLTPSELTSGRSIGRLAENPAGAQIIPNLLLTFPHEELLFIFDSGRTVAMPATQLEPISPENLDWQQATLQEPRVREELAAIHPIAKMPLYETCIQTSRRGFLKKMKTSFLTAHIAENYIGTGVKMPSDKTCGITFADKDDLFVMVSQEGYLFSMPAERLPTAIEEVLHLGIIDHIVSMFVAGQKPSILFITQNGKAVHRDTNWLEPASSFKTRGQPLLSKERREAGIRIIGAAPVDETDWGAFLQSDGNLSLYKLTDLLSTGSIIPAQASGSILSFASFQLPELKPKAGSAISARS